METKLNTIERFQIRKVPGEGGTGIVCLAYDPKLKRDVAIKTPVAATADETQTLLDEAQAVSTLRNQAVLPVRQCA